MEKEMYHYFANESYTVLFRCSATATDRFTDVDTEWIRVPITENQLFDADCYVSIHEPGVESLIRNWKKINDRTNP
jgi:hypothetical protein